MTLTVRLTWIVITTQSSTDPLIIKRYKKDFNTGAFFVFKGGPSGLAVTPTFAFYPPTDAQVNRLTGGLDINGDGFDDLIAGATNLGGGGGVMVLWGRPEPNPSRDPSSNLRADHPLCHR